jgi:hypothetical protein
MITTTSKSIDGENTIEIANKSIMELKRQPPPGVNFPSRLAAMEIYDRTSLLLTIWIATVSVLSN